jgi:hypothetical protein
MFANSKPKMENLGPLNILRIPLQLLQEFPDISFKIQVEGASLKHELVAWFGQYEPSVQHSIRTQLDWACLHTDYDFQSVLKNVKTQNEDIVQYFQFLRAAIAA